MSKIDVESRFGRASLLAGEEMMDRLAATRILIFGLGGVGSWCVEALARTGFGHFTLVDSDTVAESNSNRQLPAMSSTVGRPKVDVLADRIRDINPDAEVIVRHERFTPDTADSFDFTAYDYVVDAIDSLTDKAQLILRATDPATAPRKAFFSSMGAARKLEISKIATTDFWRVQGCPLARALRNWFKRREIYPRRKFTCVYSPETLPHRRDDGGGVNGTFAHATAAFGLTLASLIVKKELN